MPYAPVFTDKVVRMPTALALLPLAPAQVSSVLKTFRKDAGWTAENDDALAGALRPGSRVQWMTVRAGQKTVALVRLEMAPPQFCAVSDLIVLSGYRGRGVGAWFMAQIERLCLAQGIRRVVLQAAPPSRAFYDKLRFVEDPLVPGFLKKELMPLRRPVSPLGPLGPRGPLGN
jgi:GNAT superfamily N-acetyltransferase